MESSLENLTGYILENAKAEAAKITEAAREEADLMIKEAKEKADAAFKKQKEQLQNASEQKIKEAAKQKENKLQKDKTAYACVLIDKLFDGLCERLDCMTQDEFIDFYVTAVKKAGLSGEYTAVLGKKTADKTDDAHKKLLNITEKEYSVILSERTVENEGGFILEKTPVEYSFLYSEIAEELKKQEKPTLLKHFIV